MNKDQYRLLIQFPKDKSYLSHKKLQDNLDKLGSEGDYNYLEDKYNELFNMGYVDGFISKGLRITDIGLQAIIDSEKTVQEASGNKKNKILDIILTRKTLIWTIVSVLLTVIALLIALNYKG